LRASPAEATGTSTPQQTLLFRTGYSGQVQIRCSNDYSSITKDGSGTNWTTGGATAGSIASPGNGASGTSEWVSYNAGGCPAGASRSDVIVQDDSGTFGSAFTSTAVGNHNVYERTTCSNGADSDTATSGRVYYTIILPAPSAPTSGDCNIISFYGGAGGGVWVTQLKYSCSRAGVDEWEAYAYAVEGTGDQHLYEPTTGGNGDNLALMGCAVFDGLKSLDVYVKVHNAGGWSAYSDFPINFANHTPSPECE
jgi:hypothetical protein